MFYRGPVGVDRLALLGAVPLLVAASPLLAQNLQTPNAPDGVADALPPTPAPDAPLAEDEVGFTADALDYDDDSEVVTANGNVHMLRNGNRLRADSVTWNRQTGVVKAIGSVVVTNPGGDTAYGDSAELTDDLKDGVVEDMLLVLADGGRLAAMHGRRVAGVTTLQHAAYTPCSVVCDDGVTPREPVWKITAVRVIHDPQRHRVSYRDARLSLLGVPVLWLPTFSHPDGSGEGGASGLLVPKINYNRVNGFELAMPYYWQIAPNRDITITPHFYSKVAPMAEVKYRQLTSNGAFQIGGDLTYSKQVPIGSSTAVGNREIRGYLDANGQFQLGPDWTLSGSIRLTTDKTFLRRYDISSDDRLRSVLKAERITDDSYLSIAGWFFQSLRVGDKQGQSPIALPAIDYRRRLADPLLGGKIELQANSLAITRTGGQDTQRAFASARWDLRRLTTLGQEVTFTLYGRGDIYHSSDIDETATAVYRGEAGWNSRFIGAAAVDMRWPFIGELFGGTQQVTPHVQLAASPHTKNLPIPNEDARAIDLEDSNLFALNRFAGYDRWEDSARITYGLDYALTLPRFSLDGLIGQSYRLNARPSLFPDGTGLTDRLSDIVGRFTVKYGSFVSVTERFRLDKDTLKIRRNEIDMTLGSKKTYLTAGYLKLNRDITGTIEDLRDREEIRLGGRVQFLTHWSLFGATTIDLTSKGEDATSTADGFEPVRHRIGLAYEDDCFQFGVTWRRDYLAVGDARSGNTYQLSLAFKNLGR